MYVVQPNVVVDMKRRQLLCVKSFFLHTSSLKWQSHKSQLWKYFWNFIHDHCIFIRTVSFQRLLSALHTIKSLAGACLSQQHTQEFSDCLLMGNLMLMYCDLWLQKSKIEQQTGLLLATLRYSEKAILIYELYLIMQIKPNKLQHP